MSTKYNKSMRLPQDNYILRCTEESFGPSKSSKNPMITLKFEVQTPDEIDIAGEKVTVAGLELNRYLTTQVIENGEINLDKTQKCAERLVGTPSRKGEYQLFGLDPAGFNPENPQLGFKGRLVHARLTCEERAQRKDPTAEQVRNNQQGDIIINPVTKQPVVYYEPKIAEIYGLAPETNGAM